MTAETYRALAEAFGLEARVWIKAAGYPCNTLAVWHAWTLVAEALASQAAHYAHAAERAEAIPAPGRLCAVCVDLGNVDIPATTERSGIPCCAECADSHDNREPKNEADIPA